MKDPVDPVLESRLIALTQQLARVGEPKKILRDLKLQKDELENLSLLDGIRDGLESLIFGKVQPLRDRLAGIRDTLDPDLRERQVLDRKPSQQEIQQAWEQFDEVNASSQEIFQECAEWIGGLAFRAKAIDEKICQVADQLITSCSNVLGASAPISIPAHKEVRAKTIGNLLRLRFPAWSIWSLPLIAHEYGHVVIADLNRLKAGLEEFLMDQRPYLTALVPEYRDLVRTRDLASVALRKAEASVTADQELIDCRRAYLDVLEEKVSVAKTRVEEDAGYLIDEFFVDSFGTYVLGPAYACAAVFTRLNPILSSAPRLHWDHERAEVIIAMLEKINDQSQAADLYSEIITRIKNYWNTAVTLSNAPGTKGIPLDPDRLQELRNLVGRFWVELENRSSLKLRYAYSTGADDGAIGENGWSRALDWADDWEKTLKAKLGVDNEKVVLPAVPDVRDALNMAWVCRLRSPDDEKEIDREAQKLCLRIAKERREQAVKQNRPR